jgi:hypothetical protein
MIGNILAIANVSTTAVAADNVEGDFTFSGSGSAGNKLANQPLRSGVIGGSVSSITVYFVASYDYKGFSKTGASITESGTVKKDGITLHKAVLSSSTVTITQLTPTV